MTSRRWNSNEVAQGFIHYERSTNRADLIEEWQNSPVFYWPIFLLFLSPLWSILLRKENIGILEYNVLKSRTCLLKRPGRRRCDKNNSVKHVKAIVKFVFGSLRQSNDSHSFSRKLSIVKSNQLFKKHRPNHKIGKKLLWKLSSFQPNMLILIYRWERCMIFGNKRVKLFLQQFFFNLKFFISKKCIYFLCVEF